MNRVGVTFLGIVMKRFMSIGILPLYLFAMHDGAVIKKVIFQGDQFVPVSYRLRDDNRLVNNTPFNPNAYVTKTGDVRPIPKAGVLPLVYDEFGTLHALLCFDKYDFLPESRTYYIPMGRPALPYQYAIDIASQPGVWQELDAVIFAPHQLDKEIHEAGCELPSDYLIEGRGGCMAYVAILKSTCEKIVREKIDAVADNQFEIIPFGKIVSAIQAADKTARKSDTSIGEPVAIEGYGRIVTYIARMLAKRLVRLQALNDLRLRLT